MYLMLSMYAFLLRDLEKFEKFSLNCIPEL